MSTDIIDQNGNYTLLPGTLYPSQQDNPAYRARVAIALGVNTWAYAPAAGHNLNAYKNLKATSSTVSNFEKEATQYLSPYGPTVISRFLPRGQSQLQFQVTKETLLG